MDVLINFVLPLKTKIVVECTVNEKTIKVPKELILKLKEENEKMLERVTNLEKKLKEKQH